jgi:predicted RNase H-like HicB family nuclease
LGPVKFVADFLEPVCCRYGGRNRNLDDGASAGSAEATAAVDVGEWRVLFPDVPGCEAKGFSLDDAKYAAASALQWCIRGSRSTAPLPMDMATVQRSVEWLSQNHVDLSRAIVSMVPVAA